MDKLITFVGLMLALSIASERLVEIIKGFIPYLNNTNLPPNQEAIRCSLIQIMAVFAGVLTSFLAKESLPADINNLSIFVIGLLASGGSGFWNAILTYVTNIKQLKKVEVEAAEAVALTAK